MRRLQLTRLLPLCCGLLMMAAEGDCFLIIENNSGGRDNGDEEEEPACPDVDAVCDLQCELATNSEGCRICSCADPGGEGEGEGESGEEGEGEGESGECRTDDNCPAGERCVVVAVACPDCLPDDPSCSSECTESRACKPVPSDPCVAALCEEGTQCVVDVDGNAQCVRIESQCQSDDACGFGWFCDFRCPPDSGAPGDGDPQVCDVGTCRPLPTVGCEAIRCSSGFQCVNTPEGGKCIPTEDQCSSDDECGPGQICRTICIEDVNCPECDSCTELRICSYEPDACEALCGPNITCHIDPAGELRCGPPTPPPPPPRLCSSDEECGPDLVCNAGEELCLENPDCAGADVCTTECWGLCVLPGGLPPFPRPDCSSDEQCADGLVCSAGEEFCLRNPDCTDDPDVICSQECWGFCKLPGDPLPPRCEVNENCAPDFFCNFDGFCKPRDLAPGVGECVYNEMCGTDRVCDTSICLSDPSCLANPDEPCDAACWGKCVPAGPPPPPPPPPRCMSDDDCREWDFCTVDGFCKPREYTCTSDAECPFDQLCIEGLCRFDQTPPSCTTNDDCLEGFVCNPDGFCVLPDQMPPPPPPPPETCREDAECQDNEKCVITEVCTACLPNDPNCMPMCTREGFCRPI